MTFRFDIQPLVGTPETMNMMKEWGARSDALMRRSVYEATRKVRDDVRSRLPGEAAGLRNSLKIRQVSGLSEHEFGYVVMAVSAPREVEDIKPAEEILFVQRRRVQASIPPDIEIMEEYGPWTVDTIPTWPRTRYARVITRKVLKGTVDRIRADRNRDRREWEKKLRAAGARRGGRKLTVDAVQKAVPDVAYESLKYEFGIGAAPKPHWRPALIDLKKGQSLRQIAKIVGPYLTEPGNRKWSKRPSAGRVNIGKIKSLQAFQKTLGVRFG